MASMLSSGRRQFYPQSCCASRPGVRLNGARLYSEAPAAVKWRGAPSGHVVNIREVRLAAGAEFVVMVCGDIMTMPGLPKVPSACAIDVDDEGRISGLF